jgi:hypothetical protein
VHNQPAIPNGSQLRRLPHPLHLRRTARDEGVSRLIPGASIRRRRRSTFFSVGAHAAFL